MYTFAGSSDLPQNSSVMLEQIRVLDKSRLTDYVGRINNFTMDEAQRRKIENAVIKRLAEV